MDLDDILADISASLDLPPTFIGDLWHDGDDWSFTIKAHALIETGLTEVLVMKMGHAELAERLPLLPMDGRFGKLGLLEAFWPPDPTTRRYLRYIQALGNLRNRCVHNIRRVNFSLAKHFRELATMKPDEFNAQHSALDLVFKSGETYGIGGQQLTAQQMFKDDPRLLIASSLKVVLVWINVLRLELEVKRMPWITPAPEANNEYRAAILDALAKETLDDPDVI